jgi:hypothetical protein
MGTRDALRLSPGFDELLLVTACMANIVITQSTISWTPPSAPVSSGQSAFTTQASYNAQNVGAIDVPSGTTPMTVFNIPFGSVDKVRVLIVKSLMTSDVDVGINSSSDPVFTLAPGGSFRYEAPIDPITGTHPIVSASFTILVAPVNTEAVQFWVFGD